MWDACASKRGFVCGREAISIEYTVGQGEGKRWNLPYGWKKDKGWNWKGGEEEGEKEETQQSTSTHLMLPTGPRDADSTVLLIHFQLVPLSFAVSLYSRCPFAALFVMLLVLYYDLADLKSSLSDCRVCWCIFLMPECVCLWS